jgi:FkbM family methyltransferase
LKKFLKYLASDETGLVRNVVSNLVHGRKLFDTGEVGQERRIMTRIGDKKYNISSDDNYLNRIGRVFEPEMVRLFDSLIEANNTVFDIGANIGCTSILFGDKAEKVFSFEPSPTTFQFLRKNLVAAKMSHVIPVNSGLGKTGGVYELAFSPQNRSGGFVLNKAQVSQGLHVESVQILRGDSYTKQEGIDKVDFIKIDVEGFERDVIEGLSQTIAGSKPIVALELNHWCLNAFQRITIPDFFDFLRSIFPYLYAVEKNDIADLHNTDEAYHVMFSHITKGFKYPNLIGAFEHHQLAKFGKKYSRAITPK